MRSADEMSRWRTARIAGQQSFILNTNTVELALTSMGGMLGPVTFFPQEKNPIRPYAIAPWAEEQLPANTPPMLRALRGDWFCSAFGENAALHGGRQLPPHGETANLNWHAVDRDDSIAGSWIRLGVTMSLQGGRCEATTALLTGHSLIYQRHDLEGLTGPINPGHHATLAFPDVEACPRSGSQSRCVARLSFSPHIYAHTAMEPLVGPNERGRSILQPHSPITKLHSVPCVDSSTADLTRYPARRGCDDLAIVCADPSHPFAWSAVACPTLGYVWFALRDPKHLASTVLWFSNGGRRFPPWNGRHIDVLGIEDVTAFFHVGITASCRQNLLTVRGIRTCLNPGTQGRLSIPYIQGVARIPRDFDRVAIIEPSPDRSSVQLHSDSGLRVGVACHLDFLRTGALPGLEFS